MLKILHLSDIHMGSGFGHGRIDPVTGWNTRLLDFSAALERCIDRAIAEPVDLVLFGGDAFPDATPPPMVQEAFARQFRRLADAHIPTVLLVGNHDQHAQGQGGASLCIYRTLGVPGFVVGDTLTTHRLETPHGPVQVLTLPWLTRSALLTKPETVGMSLAEVGALLLDRLRAVLEGEIRKLDPEIPAILLAHLMSDRARFGAERMLGVGKAFAIPLDAIARPEFDYVALGHVHRHQNLNPSNEPAVVYPGSIERVDFSEEDEEKGYVMVTITPGSRGDRTTQWEFCPLPARRFCTLRVDLSESADPLADLLKAIDPAKVTDAVVRVIYRVRAEQLHQIELASVRDRLDVAHTYNLQAELVSQLARPRLPDMDASSLDPLVALEAYLGERSDLRGIAADMIEAARDLLGYASPILEVELPEPSISEEIEPEPDPTERSRQLRLL
jgi:exonuclease SbcD